MTFRDWITNNYKELLKLSKRIDNENGQEILHFTLEKFLTNKTELLDNLKDEDKLVYLSRTLSLQSKSSSSQFYREFRKFTILSNNDILVEKQEEERDETDVEEIQILFIQEELKKIHWFSSLLFQRYIQSGCSAQKLADELLIPLSTCQYHIRKVRNHIRNEWNNNINKNLLM